MSVYLHFLLILTGLTGIFSITTVSKVSVKAGSSISIPCLYDSQYLSHVKYLCRGYYYSHCSSEVQTNIPRSSEKFSISDDKSTKIFTVTINDVMNTDMDYWCAVEITGQKDARQYFHMSVTGDVPSLYVDHQEVVGLQGDAITINCYYHNSGEIRWCKLGIFCVKWPTGSIQGTRVTINTSVPNVFTVTMSGLRTKSSGWYYCGKGDLQMPVHVTVLGRAASTLTTASSTSEHGISVSSSKEPTNEGGLLSSSDHLQIFCIRLSVVAFAVMVTSFIWYIVKRYKQTKDKSSDPATAEGVQIGNTSGEVAANL